MQVPGTIAASVSRTVGNMFDSEEREEKARKLRNGGGPRHSGQTRSPSRYRFDTRFERVQRSVHRSLGQQVLSPIFNVLQGNNRKLKYKVWRRNFLEYVLGMLSERSAGPVASVPKSPASNRGMVLDFDMFQNRLDPVEFIPDVVHFTIEFH
jgi:hypothetical protein